MDVANVSQRGKQIGAWRPECHKADETNSVVYSADITSSSMASRLKYRTHKLPTSPSDSMQDAGTACCNYSYSCAYFEQALGVDVAEQRPRTQSAAQNQSQ